jgi:hypothetical protein
MRKRPEAMKEVGHAEAPSDEPAKTAPMVDESTADGSMADEPAKAWPMEPDEPAKASPMEDE